MTRQRFITRMAARLAASVLPNVESTVKRAVELADALERAGVAEWLEVKSESASAQSTPRDCVEMRGGLSFSYRGRLMGFPDARAVLRAQPEMSSDWTLTVECEHDHASDEAALALLELHLTGTTTTFCLDIPDGRRVYGLGKLMHLAQSQMRVIYVAKGVRRLMWDHPSPSESGETPP